MRTSTIGTWIGIAYSTSISDETAGSAPRISATSVDVPPMSYVIRFGMPARRPIVAAAMTPDAGPDITVFAASRETWRAETMPPLPFITSTSPR